MNQCPQILVLADSPVGEELSARLGGPRIVPDPYRALQALHDAPYKAVILTAPRLELPSLCRALRRVGGQAKLVALSTVAAEPEVRTLAGRELDDYFIYPTARADMAAIRRLAGLDVPPAPAQAAAAEVPAPETGEAAAPVRPAQMGALLEAATSMAALESALAGQVAAQLGAKVRWVNASATGADRALLRTDGPPPRALVSDSEAPLSAPARRFLEDIGLLLPSLAAAAKRTESLHRLAITDHLTGAYNRRYFYHLTDHILRQAKASRYRVTLLLYDIDNFKHYNETYGHAAGDDILRETAALMKRTSRSHDVVARIGGDEFAALFWDVQPPRRASSQPLQDFQKLAERFRRAVSAHSFPSLGPEAQGVLSISGGLANFPGDGQNCRELLRAADQALRSVKRSGKNGIQIVGTT